MLDDTKAMQRRQFLSLIGSGSALGSMLIAAPAAAGELLADHNSAARPTQRPDTVPVGILLPRSHLKPHLGASFSAGLAMALAQHPDLHVVVHAEDIGIGGAGLHEALGRMHDQHRPAVVIGALDGRLADAAAERCHGKSVYLDCSVGGIVPQRASEKSHHLRCTLGHWQSAYALGRWSADQGKRAVMVCNLYDAGYDGLYAFQLGFEAGGGTVMPTIVVDVPGKELSLDAALAQARTAAPDVVYASFHDHLAGPFLKAWSENPMAGQAVLVGNAFMVDHAAQHAAGAPIDGLVVCSSYDPALANSANQTFRQSASASNQCAPDQFTVLGFDAGMLIATACANGRLDTSPSQLAARLANATFTGPRGIIAMDPRTGSAVVPHYLSVCTQTAGGLERRVIAQLPTIDECDERIVAWQNSLRSGWTNPYMSV